MSSIYQNIIDRFKNLKSNIEDIIKKIEKIIKFIDINIDEDLDGNIIDKIEEIIKNIGVIKIYSYNKSNYNDNSINIYFNDINTESINPDKSIVLIQGMYISTNISGNGASSTHNEAIIYSYNITSTRIEINLGNESTYGHYKEYKS